MGANLQHELPTATAPRTAPARETALERVTALDRLCLERLAAAAHEAGVHCVLWDKTAAPKPAETKAVIRILDRGALLRLARDAAASFGDLYTDGRIELEGDLVGVLTTVTRRSIEATGTTAPSRLALRRLGGSRSEARANIHRHYDLGNDFYRLWLDRELVYTCAYFPTEAADLETAQQTKMDLVCRKAGLRPGDRVVEAGCGWGALALHMARHHDVTVEAWNISREQIAYARERARREGLAARVTFVEDDYRAIRTPCDVFVSVGMLEHVGPSHYGELGEVLDRCLDRGHGRGLLHFIGRNRPAPIDPWIGKRIFPGAYAPALHEVMAAVLEPKNLSVLDVENLRLHYAKTCEHWLARFEAAAERVEALFDTSFVRAWRLYLAGSVAAFRAGSLQLFQIAFARGAHDDLPWTRAHLYRVDA